MEQYEGDLADAAGSGRNEMKMDTSHNLPSINAIRIVPRYDEFRKKIPSLNKRLRVSILVCIWFFGNFIPMNQFVETQFIRILCFQIQYPKSNLIKFDSSMSLTTLRKTKIPIGKKVYSSKKKMFTHSLEITNYEVSSGIINQCFPYVIIMTVLSLSALKFLKKSIRISYKMSTILNVPIRSDPKVCCFWHWADFLSNSLQW